MRPRAASRSRASLRRFAGCRCRTRPVGRRCRRSRRCRGCTSRVTRASTRPLSRRNTVASIFNGARVRVPCASGRPPNFGCGTSAVDRTEPVSPSRSVTLITFLPSGCSARDSVIVASIRMFTSFATYQAPHRCREASRRPLAAQRAWGGALLVGGLPGAWAAACAGPARMLHLEAPPGGGVVGVVACARTGASTTCCAWRLPGRLVQSTPGPEMRSSCTGTSTSLHSSRERSSGSRRSG